MGESHGDDIMSVYVASRSVQSLGNHIESYPGSSHLAVISPVGGEVTPRRSSSLRDSQKSTEPSGLNPRPCALPKLNAANIPEGGGLTSTLHTNLRTAVIHFSDETTTSRKQTGP